MQVEILKLGVYAVEEIQILPSICHSSSKILTLAVLCEDEAISIVRTNSPMFTLKKLNNILLQSPKLFLTKKYGQ